MLFVVCVVMLHGLFLLCCLCACVVLVFVALFVCLVGDSLCDFVWCACCAIVCDV